MMPNPDVRMTWGEFKELVDAAPDVSDETPIGWIDIGGMMLWEKNMVVSIDEFGELAVG